MAANPFDLTGKAAIVTGASSGLDVNSRAARRAPAPR